MSIEVCKEQFRDLHALLDFSLECYARHLKKRLEDGMLEIVSIDLIPEIIDGAKTVLADVMADVEEIHFQECE